MARKNFSEFQTRTVPVTSDFIVGYNPAGPIETKTTIGSLLNLAESALSLNAIDTDVRALTADFKAVETVVETTSASWNTTRTVVQTNSATWAIDSTTDTEVRALTADFKAVETVVSTTSASWNSVYTTTNGTSAALGIIATLVQTNSASWEESAEIIPTVTNYLSTNNILISSLEVTNQIKANSSNVPVTIVSVATNKVFTDSDTNKVFHFDTTGGNIIATFPDNLTNGFNAAIMNVGTNSLEISATNIKALGVTIVEQYGSAFVYKQGSDVFAVGRLV
jgi:hypothetical protein